MDKKKESIHLQNAMKPEGEYGEQLLDKMNAGNHEILANWGLEYAEIEKGSRMLDIGCGGGANLRRLMERNPEGRVTGIDYSDVSVRKSRETNADAIKAGKCEVMKADVNDMPFDDDTFGFASAFETIYFWPDIENAFREARRVLRDGGIFFVCNESDGHDENVFGDSKSISGMSFYTVEDIEKLMKDAGFRSIEYHVNEERHHIVVIGVK